MKILKKAFYIDMHVSPAVVFRITICDQNFKKVEKYVGDSKWTDSSEEELNNLILVGSSREIEKNVADEFIKDFDVCKYR